MLEIAPGERIDAVVEMNQPGITILGDTDHRTRQLGLGVMVEYAGRAGKPQWTVPPDERWDHTVFGRNETAPDPDERIPLVFKQKWAGNCAVDHWTINSKEYPKTAAIRVRTNGRYRLIFDNQSDDMHPVHLHRHSFELVNVAGRLLTNDVTLESPAIRPFSVDRPQTSNREFGDSWRNQSATHR